MHHPKHNPATVAIAIREASVAALQLHCDPCDASTPHTMAEMTDGAIAFICHPCGTQTVLREESSGEPVSVA